MLGHFFRCVSTYQESQAESHHQARILLFFYHCGHDDVVLVMPEMCEWALAGIPGAAGRAAEVPVDGCFRCGREQHAHGWEAAAQEVHPGRHPPPLVNTSSLDLKMPTPAETLLYWW